MALSNVAKITEWDGIQGKAVAGGVGYSVYVGVFGDIIRMPIVGDTFVIDKAGKSKEGYFIIKASLDGVPVRRSKKTRGSIFFRLFSNNRFVRIVGSLLLLSLAMGLMLAMCSGK